MSVANPIKLFSTLTNNFYTNQKKKENEEKSCIGSATEVS